MRFYFPLLLLVCTTAAAPQPNQQKLVEDTIKHLQPALSQKAARSFARSILKHSRAYGLDWVLLASLIAQESSFRPDPQGCLKKGKKCSDWGIAQINYATWGTALHLDKRRLVQDADYNISVMANILNSLKAKYGKEKGWATRYHSFSRTHRNIYATCISPKYAKIVAYTQRNH